MVMAQHPVVNRTLGGKQGNRLKRITLAPPLKEGDFMLPH
jgi:hypothetical protein